MKVNFSLLEVTNHREEDFSGSEEFTQKSDEKITHRLCELLNPDVKCHCKSTLFNCL